MHYEPYQCVALAFTLLNHERRSHSKLSVLQLFRLHVRTYFCTYDVSIIVQHTFVVWRTAPLHLDDYLRLICFLSTSVYSALGVSAIMRYINRRFTYLLTYLLTYLRCHRFDVSVSDRIINEM